MTARILPILFFAFAQAAGPASAQMNENDPMAIFAAGRDQKEALQINGHIYEAYGFGNTFMVTTPDGNVIIDTSIAFMAPRHKQLLRAASKNSNESGWLEYGITTVKKQIEKAEEFATPPK